VCKACIRSLSEENSISVKEKKEFSLLEAEATKCSVSDPDWIRIQSGQWIGIRIQEGKNDLQK
jgi:hypothetical protein